MSKVQVVYVKHRGPVRVTRINPNVEVTRFVNNKDHDLTDELRQARVIDRPRFISSVYGWGR